MRKIHIALLLFFIVSLIELFSEKRWEGRVTTFDIAGYYMYLPATFIYKDLGHLDYYSYVEDNYHPTPAKGYAIYYQPKTGKKVMKYPMGVAIGEMPFFLLAHGYCLLTQSYKPDGYTLPYQFSIAMSTLVWVLIGLLFLGKFLSKYYNDTVAAIVMLIVGFGTNLYAYTVYDVGMSHGWMFMLFSMILYYTQQLYTTRKPQYMYLLGALCALVAISRPVDILIGLFPLFWGISGKAAISERVLFFRKNAVHLLIGFLCFFLVLGLQMSYWKYTTGDWVHFSYEEERFFFLKPHIIDGLFSYRKGWFLYTPIALIGMLALILLYFYDKANAILIAIYFIIIIYVVFCWISWFYGWSFGCRALIESLAVLSIPLGAFLHYLIKWRNITLISAATAVFGFFIWLNVYQSHQYMTMALPGDHITKEYYWRVWNVMHATDEDREYLMK